jgi:hypothetical protein
MRTPLHHATATRLRTALRALALCAVISPAICVAQNAVIDGFIPTSDLPSRQLDLSSATLRTGKVLMTDGQNVDIYDPATRAFSAGAPLMVSHNGGSPATFSTTLLADGRVLIAGGGQGIASAELFDPTSGISSLTASLNQGRQSHSAVRLLDGRVLLTGGEVWDDDAGRWQQVASSEIYDPQSAQFVATGSMNHPRLFAFANLLQDGTVLISGGLTANADGSISYPLTVEVFDPATGIFSDTADMAGVHLTSTSTATTLRDGRILFTSGASAEIYDPVLANFSPAGACRKYGTTTLPTSCRMAKYSLSVAGTALPRHRPSCSTRSLAASHYRAPCFRHVTVTVPHRSAAGAFSSRAAQTGMERETSATAISTALKSIPRTLYSWTVSTGIERASFEWRHYA